MWYSLVWLGCLQIWHLQPDVQAEVNLALRDMRRMQAPIVAFHVRGDGRDEDFLFDVRWLLSLLSLEPPSSPAAMRKMRGLVHDTREPAGKRKIVTQHSW